MSDNVPLSHRVQMLLAEAIQVSPEMVTADLAFGDIPQWDSLGHMEVMLKLEDVFGLRSIPTRSQPWSAYQKFAAFLRKMVMLHDPGSQSSQLVEFASAVTIPEYLIGEIQSKLAYADEQILAAHVSQDLITLQVAPLSTQKQSDLIDKVQRVVLSMAKGAIRPKMQILEDHLDRETPYHQDPMPELIERGLVNQESEGIFSLGPLLTRLIAYFESQFIALADSFGAAPYRFPTLIPARYLERVNYFRAFPHSLTFATHLREDLDVIDQFAQHAICDHEGLQAPPDLFPASRLYYPQRSAITCTFHWQISSFLKAVSQPLPWVTASDTRQSTWIPRAHVEFHHAGGHFRRFKGFRAGKPRDRPPANEPGVRADLGWLIGSKAQTTPSS